MSFYCAAGRVGDLLVSAALPSLFSDTRTKMSVSLACVFVATICNIAMVMVNRKKRHLLDFVELSAHERQPFLVAIKSFPLPFWLCLGVSTVLYGIIGQQLQFVPTVRKEEHCC